jgi:hypothetical protein
VPPAPAKPSAKPAPRPLRPAPRPPVAQKKKGCGSNVVVFALGLSAFLYWLLA